MTHYEWSCAISFWNPYTRGFISGEAVASIFDELRNSNYPDGPLEPLKNLIDKYLPKPTENKKALKKLLESFKDDISSTSKQDI